MVDRSPVRIAQYGTSHAHAHGHAAVLKDSPEVDFCGIFEPDPIRRQALRDHASYAGTPWFDRKETMLRDPSIAAIAIEGAVHENLAFARESLERDKHIWLDKPAGEDLEEFRALVELARERQLLIQLGYMFRYNAAFRHIMDWHQKGFLGEVFTIRGRMSTALSQARREQLARYQGGMVFELLCHLVDIVVYMLGRPVDVHSFLRNDLGMPPGFADNTLVVFEYDEAMVMLGSAATEVEPFPMRRFEVYGTHGSAVIQPLEPPQLQFCLDQDRDGYRKGWQEVSVPWTPRYIDDVIAFAADLRGEKSPDRSLDHELLVQETLLRAAQR